MKHIPRLLFSNYNLQSKIAKRFFAYILLFFITLSLSVGIFYYKSEKHDIESLYSKNLSQTFNNLDSIYKSNIDKLSYLRTNSTVLNAATLTRDDSGDKLYQTVSELTALTSILNNSEQNGTFRFFSFADNSIRTEFIIPITDELPQRSIFYGLDKNTFKDYIYSDGKTEYYAVCTQLYNNLYENIGILEWRISLKNIFSKFTNTTDNTYIYFDFENEGKTYIIHGDSYSKTTDMQQGGIRTAHQSGVLPQKATMVSKGYYIKFITIFAAILILLIIIFVPLSLYISGSVSKNVTEPLYNFLTELENGSDYDKISDNSDTETLSEVNIIKNKFLSLIDIIKKHDEENKQHEINMEKMKLELLQSNINPHFLFNSLSSLRYIEDGKQMNSAIRALAGFYRSVLSDGNMIITLSKEINIIKNYIDFYNYSQQFEIDASYETDNEAEDFCILKNTLQPIVENSILHGINHNDHKGRIAVCAKKKKNKIIIFVEDNGVGMSKEKIEQIEKLVNNETYGKAHYGLRNVISRLKIHYGKRFSFYIESEKNKGTRVSIIISDLNNEESEKGV